MITDKTINIMNEQSLLSKVFKYIKKDFNICFPYFDFPNKIRLIKM